jgi:hypothetical protein
MSSRARVFSVPGSQFDAGVVFAGEVTATAPVGKLSLPASRIALLAELPGSTPAEQQEQKNLITEQFDLDTRVMSYVMRALASRRTDLEKKHELAKAAVRQQQKAVEDLKERTAQDSQESLRAENKLRRAQTVAFDAVTALKNMSRFSPAADIAEAKRRVEVAEEKVRLADRESADWNMHLNQTRLVTARNASLKLDELVNEVSRIEEMLAGRDPILRELGILSA